MTNYNNYNGYPFNNPYQTFNQQQQSNFQFVNGIEGAKSFILQPNQTVLLMDSDNAVFYIKQSNNLGQSFIKTYKFEEVTNNVQSNKYVTVEDFNSLKEQVNKLLKGDKTNEPDIPTTNTK